MSYQEGDEIVSDDLTKKRPQDSSKISTSEDWEVDYWTKTLGCTKQELINAVKAVGNLVVDVKKHLGK
ncbi:MAG: hypothetical protein US15_C0036G0007 [Candidatus Moranbacteria bacterium GW2011_GWF1_36_4]|nr:MAG: hypothetical protein US15_C0036G0007 [Candidatus Moranbacteria bacterium GW2011_GWF1_36_4]